MISMSHRANGHAEAQGCKFQLDVTYSHWLWSSWYAAVGGAGCHEYTLGMGLGQLASPTALASMATLQLGWVYLFNQGVTSPPQSVAGPCETWPNRRGLIE